MRSRLPAVEPACAQAVQPQPVLVQVPPGSILVMGEHMLEHQALVPFARVSVDEQGELVLEALNELRCAVMRLQLTPHISPHTGRPVVRACEDGRMGNCVPYCNQMPRWRSNQQQQQQQQQQQGLGAGPWLRWSSWQALAGCWGWLARGLARGQVAGTSARRLTSS